MNPSKYNKIVVSLMLLPLVLIGAGNFIVDPLQYYRKTLFSTGFSANQRQQNPGLAKNYPYDTVIIGDSRTENMLPGNVRNYLGFDALKLSMSGASAHEQALILNLALGTGKVKNVLWLLSAERFKRVYEVSDRSGGFPMHLYTGGMDATFKYLLSLDTTMLSISFLLGNSEDNLEKLNTWYEKDEFSVEAVRNNYNMYCRVAKRRNISSESVSLDDSSNVDESISVNLQSIVEKHKDVNFYLYFPPVSMAQHVLNAQFYPSRLSETISFTEKVYDSVGASANTEIYNFLDVESLSHDLESYKDISHYNINIDNYILESMANGRHRFQHDNMTHFRNQLIESAEQYVLPFASDCI